MKNALIVDDSKVVRRFARTILAAHDQVGWMSRWTAGCYGRSNAENPISLPRYSHFVPPQMNQGQGSYVLGW